MQSTDSSVEETPSAKQTTPPEREARAPAPDASADERVWICMFKPEDSVSAHLNDLGPGETIDWRSAKAVDGVEPGDRVVYWRMIGDGRAGRGGVVGFGRVTGASYQPDLSSMKSAADAPEAEPWHYYPTQIETLFVDDPIGRDALRQAADFKPNDRAGSIQRLSAAQARNLLDYVAEKHPDFAPRSGPASEAAGSGADAEDAASPQPGVRRTFVDPSVADVGGDGPLVGDAPAVDTDALGRAPLASILAARLNRVWIDENAGGAGAPGRSGKAFIVHVDAPWGGGKTTFAGFLARILGPRGARETQPTWLRELRLDAPEVWPAEFNRPWRIVDFNAWRHQHVDPPWWCLYRAIQKQCFGQVRARPRPAPVEEAGLAPRRREAGLWGLGGWLRLWASEVWWRASDPKLRLSIVTAVVATALVLAGLFVGGFRDAIEARIGAVADVGAAVVWLTAGGAWFWTFASTFTLSLMPGTPSAENNYALGAGDPLERFRGHFDGMMGRLGAPVLVVIDDIDRCEPGYVVKLMQGLQTIFNTPKVVFAILGDRDWIERAYEGAFDEMNEINVGPEHTFGGRFVEKAFQLSLNLPNIDADQREAFVDEILGGAPARRESVAVARDKKGLSEDIEAAVKHADAAERESEVALVRERIRQAGLEAEAERALAKSLAHRAALRSAADEGTAEVVKARLRPIAGVLPANPRQIKRIINNISFYQELARIEHNVSPGDADWRRLALWVVMMTEWPLSWSTLSNHPELANQVLHGAIKTDDRAREAAWVRQMRADADLMRIIDFKSDSEWGDIKLDRAAIEALNKILPSSSRARLPADGN
ncbi:MAG: P-loop NTPase fold protein [Pseudomonadota bacterium]